MFSTFISNLINGFPLHKLQVQQPTEFHGSRYGGWVINPQAINSKSTIYSFGTGEDISFDLSIINKFHCNVYAFDPTPKCISWLKNQTLPQEFNFFPIGISDQNGEEKFYLPKNPKYISHTILEGALSSEYIKVKMATLNKIIQQLKHKKIDLLKMDIEGSEYKVIPDILKTDCEIPQLLIEFHHRFSGVGNKKTIEAVEILNSYGYKIFHVSPTGKEYSFIKI